MGDMRIINQDGKRYEFTPGKNGSLIVRGKRTSPAAFTADYTPPQRAKVVGPSDEAADVVGVDDPNKRRARVIGPKALAQYALRTYNGRQVYDTGDR